MPASPHGGGCSPRSRDKLPRPCWWQLGPRTAGVPCGYPAPQPRAGPAPVARMLVRRRRCRRPLPQPHVRTTFPPPPAVSTRCHMRLDGLRSRQLCPGSPVAPGAASAWLAPGPPDTDWVTPVEMAPKIQALGTPGVLLVQAQLRRATATHPAGAHPLGASTGTATSITNANGHSSWHGNQFSQP